MKKMPKVFLGLRFTNEDKAKIIKDLSNCTCRTFTDYARRKILDDPLCVYYRNQSYDDFTEAYIELKKDLDNILEKSQWSDTEKEWLKEQLDTIKNTVIKLYDYVRTNREKHKHSYRPGI